MSACCAFCECFFNCKTTCLVNETARLCALLEKQHEILPIIIMTQNLDLCVIRESWDTVTLLFGSVRAKVTSSRPMHGSYGYLVRGYGYKTGYSTLHTVWFGRCFFLFKNTNVNAFNLKVCVTYIG